MSAIPRQVHLIWIQGEDALAQAKPWWKERKAAWEKHMPTWKLKVHSDKSIRRLFQDPMYEALQPLYDAPNAPMAWKADIARYMLVHKHGGMYADITYEVIRNFDWMLHGRNVDFVFLHHDVQRAEKDIFMNTNNCWFAATQHHPILTAILLRLETAAVPQSFPFSVIYKVTGPQQLWRAVKPHLQSPRVRAIPSVSLDPSVTSLSYTPCEGANACRSALPCAVAIHHGQMSYVSPAERFGFHVFQAVRRNYLPALIFSILLLAIIIVATVIITRTLTRKYDQCQRSCGLVKR